MGEFAPLLFVPTRNSGAMLRTLHRFASLRCGAILLTSHHDKKTPPFWVVYERISPLANISRLDAHERARRAWENLPRLARFPQETTRQGFAYRTAASCHDKIRLKGIISGLKNCKRQYSAPLRKACVAERFSSRVTITGNKKAGLLSCFPVMVTRGRIELPFQP